MWGRNGNCRGAVACETGAILPLSRCGRGVLIPARRRAFWPDGSLSCALLGRRVAAVHACRPRPFARPAGSSRPPACLDVLGERSRDAGIRAPGRAAIPIAPLHSPLRTVVLRRAFHSAAFVPFAYGLSRSWFAVFGRSTSADCVLFGIGNVHAFQLGLHHFHLPIRL